MMYHLTTLLVGILTFVSGPRVLAQPPPIIAYDAFFGDQNTPLDQTLCSNVLGTKGFTTTLGSIPNFPYVGGISPWDSTQCGMCYAITYGDKTIFILVVDQAGDPEVKFVVSEAAMNTLTGDPTGTIGTETVSFVEVPQSECKL